MEKSVVMVVDDERQVRDFLEIVLSDHYEVLTAGSARDAIAAIRKHPVDVVLLDIMMPGMDGIEALERMKKIKKGLGVIMLSGMDSARQAVAALKKGALDYVTKPFDTEDLLEKLRRYAWRRQPYGAMTVEAVNDADSIEIISSSPRMKKVFEMVEKLGGSSSNVLITGESGTGKDLVARTIHFCGNRRNKPFVAVNCGAVPSELMESEIFGHEKGAFTGAHARKIGKFEYADGGTVFLDEVSTLPMNLQIKLLRVLQEKSFERVGGNLPIKVDIRVIAATNADLEDAVRKGLFREDLYYRLKVVPVDLPPLRERKEDIGLLTRYFLAKHCARCGKVITGITDEALAALHGYSWPGNIRELENLIERLVVLARDGVEIGLEDLPAVFCSPEAAVSHEAADFREACRLFEKHYIVSVLDKTNWNRMEAAKKMKIHRNTLLMKMKDLGIKAPRNRQP